MNRKKVIKPVSPAKKSTPKKERSQGQANSQNEQHFQFLPKRPDSDLCQVVVQSNTQRNLQMMSNQKNATGECPGGQRSEMSGLSHAALSIQRIRTESDPSVPSSKLKIVIVMNEKFSVSLDFLNSVRQQICEFLPFMNIGAEFTARDLVGCAYWHALNVGERRILGSCIRQLIKEGLPMSTVTAQNSQQTKFRFLGLAHQ